MSTSETPQTIADAAADWVARLDRAGDDPAARAELEAWLADDDRRRGAFMRARAAWSMMDRASVLNAGQAGVATSHARGHSLNDSNQREATSEYDKDHAPDTKSGPATMGRWVAMAASLALMVSTGIWLSRDEPVAEVQVATAVGEQRRVPLTDGSIAEVNTQTSLAVVMKHDAREVELERGEAFFKVAHDAARPFVVSVGDVRVQAVGTAFSVQRTSNGVEVQVTEGKVAVWSIGNATRRAIVSAGTRTYVDVDTGLGSIQHASDDIERSLAWRGGELIFDGDTLGDAATEFNRYNSVRIVIEDPSLGREKLVGRFRVNEPASFATAAANMLGATSSKSASEIRLTRP